MDFSGKKPSSSENGTFGHENSSSSKKSSKGQNNLKSAILKPEEEIEHFKTPQFQSRKVSEANKIHILDIPDVQISAPKALEMQIPQKKANRVTKLASQSENSANKFKKNKSSDSGGIRGLFRRFTSSLFNNKEIDVNPKKPTIKKQNSGRLSGFLASIRAGSLVQRTSEGQLATSSRAFGSKNNSYEPNSPLNPSYTKLKRCLHAALFCTKMNNISSNIRIYGTSSLQFNLTFKSRASVYKRLKPDRLVEEVKTKVPWYILDPQAKFMIVWSLLGVVFMVYVITLMPYIMVFVEDGTFDAFENIVRIYFILDIFINFFTAYYDSEGILITSCKKIILHYLKGWFFIDFISSFPGNFFFGNAGSANKLLRIFKLPRLFKIAGIGKIMRVKSLLKGTWISLFMKLNGGLTQTASIFAATFLLMHLVTCLFCGLPSMEEDPRNSWIYR